MTTKCSLTLWKRSIFVLALSLGFFITACDIDNGDPGNGDNGNGNGDPVVKYGVIKAEGVSHPLGYGVMVTTPAPVEGLNQTVIELFTSSQDRGNMAGITLYHSEDTVPEGTYNTVFRFDDVWEDTFICNIVISNGKNLSLDSGELSISRTVTGQYVISVDGDAMSLIDDNIYPIEIEYSGPIVSLN